MGRDWDKSGIAFHSDTWAALAEHLFPGAFGMAFASARGWHRLACAIEDAGLRIHPSIFGFVYGSGFPKATRIDTQIDRAAGVKGGAVWYRRDGGPGGHSQHIGQIAANRPSGWGMTTAPATDLAKIWAAHRYGLQALKPALEPIIVWQKPYKGKPVDSITETGAGALWIDGARIPGSWNWGKTKTDIRGKNGIKVGWRQERAENDIVSHPQGRWPANFYVDEGAAERLGKQSGVSRSSANKESDHRKTAFYRAGDAYTGGVSGERNSKNSYSDRGTAARFFLNIGWKLEESDPVLYCPKASRKERDAGLEERNRHPTLKPLKLTKWLATLLLPPEEYAPRRILVPFAGSGSEMIGAILAGWDEVIGIEMEREYCEIANARLEYWASKQSDLELFT